MFHQFVDLIYVVEKLEFWYDTCNNIPNASQYQINFQTYRFVKFGISMLDLFGNYVCRVVWRSGIRKFASSTSRKVESLKLWNFEMPEFLFFIMLRVIDTPDLRSHFGSSLSAQALLCLGSVPWLARLLPLVAMACEEVWKTSGNSEEVRELRGDPWPLP